MEYGRLIETWELTNLLITLFYHAMGQRNWLNLFSFSFLFFSLYTAFSSSSLSFLFKRIVSFEFRISFLPVFIILGNGVEEGDHTVDLQRVIVQIIVLE